MSILRVSMSDVRSVVELSAGQMPKKKDKIRIHFDHMSSYKLNPG